jgi:Zinc carboxypeptidase/Secretion system C-terminal sorting domain
MKRFLLIIVLLTFSVITFAQQNEYYFKFKINEQSDLYSLARVVSIDNVKGNEVYAYANDKEMKDFLKLGIFYEMLPNPGTLINPRMSDNIDEIKDWDVYPTYDAYVTMMNQFAANYPNLCRIVNAGPTVQNRAILFAVISDNVLQHEGELQFLYTSSMHGDETTGYVLMLRLIDYLLSNYGTDPKVTNLVNNEEIWINPLANPDGTYHGGNNTVSGATRYNANGRDLNRNFPPTDNWNSGPIQPETQDMVNLAIENHFVMSCNFHGGSEVVNYPWDAWPRLTADNNWWVYVCRQYADTVHVYAPSGYMDGFNNGMTNGYAWYYVGGGRQDYHNYFRHDRECTIELSDTKLLPPALLPAHWNYNYRSFLNYMEKALYGITGMVKDSLTFQPVYARVFISGHDIDSSFVYSDSTFGKYYRLIYTGTYNLTFSAPGYYTKTITGVYAKNDSTTNINVLLNPITTGISKNGNDIPSEYNLYQNYPNPFNPATTINYDLPNSGFVKLAVYNVLGKEIAVLVNEKQSAGKYVVQWDASSYPSGVYFYRIIAGDFTETKKMVMIK